MFSLMCNLRRISLAKVNPTFRYYAAIKTAESHRKSERLPPGFGKTTPFSLFIKENFASRKNEQPTEVFSNLTKQWKNLNEADKMKYVDEASRINEEKRSKFESMSETEKEELREQAKNLREARLKRRIRLERRKKREGQRQMSGWMLFVKEKAVKGVADIGKKQQDIIRELAVVWKSLPKSEKDAYNERAKILSNDGEICD
uniref:HMG box domain-containing protein n=1 Tax=Onchocerca volvulus TaxID=6282 RepID=A0A2K6W2R5_ONCVO